MIQVDGVGVGVEGESAGGEPRVGDENWDASWNGRGLILPCYKAAAWSHTATIRRVSGSLAHGHFASD